MLKNTNIIGSSKVMKFLVLGAGAIGSVFGGFLAKAGHDVFLVGRKPHIQAINEKGLLIDGIWGTYTVKNLKGYTCIEELAEKCKETFDIALLTVKSYDTETMLKELKKYFPDPLPVVSLQNGLGNIEKIEAYLGKEKTIGGRVIFGVEFIKPGHVRITVSADRTVIGGLKRGIERSFVEKVASVFTNAGIPADVTDDISRFLWGKVLYNCALNGLATLMNVNYGKLLSCNGTKEIMGNVIEEIFNVARAKNVSLDWKSPEEYKKLLFEELIPKTFEHHPSMLQDIRRGKKTEIDALNGAVVKMGEEIGTELPFNWTITQLIKSKEMV
jgi:2-dehydropantoate 2-reductase